MSTEPKDVKKFPPYKVMSVDSLAPYANNARTHSPAQVNKIAASIKEFGFTNPVLVDGDSGIIAGHGRVLAAQKLKMTNVPVIELSHLSPMQKKAYIIADNRLALDAGWDMDMLRTEFASLQSDEFDLALTGFDFAEIGAMMSGLTTELTDPDDVPEPEPNPVTRPGEIWTLGRHRLMCGDSTNQQHVNELMNGQLADLCFTSPPYGQQRDYKNGGIADWDALMHGVFSILPVKHDAQVLVNLGMIHRENEWIPYWDGWIEYMRTAGWRRFGWYVWDQGPGIAGDWAGRLAPSHEFVFHFNRVAEKPNKTKEKLEASIKVHGGGGQRGKDGIVKKRSNLEASLQTHKIPDSVIRIARHHGALEKGVGSHPAVFPVDLVSEMLTAFSDPDDLVFEPFCGSGTQLISAQKNGRSCFSMELAPVYADVCVRRWQAFTGQSAMLEGDERTFAQVTAERLNVNQQEAATPKAKKLRRTVAA